MLTITWIEHVSNDEVVRKMETETTYMLGIRNKFLKPIMRKDELENLTPTGKAISV